MKTSEFEAFLLTALPHPWWSMLLSVTSGCQLSAPPFNTLPSTSVATLYRRTVPKYHELLYVITRYKYWSCIVRSYSSVRRNWRRSRLAWRFWNFVAAFHFGRSEKCVFCDRRGGSKCAEFSVAFMNGTYSYYYYCGAVLLKVEKTVFYSHQ